MLHFARAAAHRHGHHPQRSGQHRGCARKRVLGGRDRRGRRGQHRRHGRHCAALHRAASSCASGPDTSHRRTSRPTRRATTGFCRSTRMSASRRLLGRGDPARAAGGAFRGGVPCAASRACTSAGGCAPPIGIPTTSCASTIAGAAAGTGRYVHESVKADAARSAQLRGELQHYPYRDISHHVETIDRYTTLAAQQMRPSAARARRWLHVAGQPATGVPAQLRRARRRPRRTGRPGRVVAEQLLRVPEVRQAVGLDTAQTRQAER